MKNFTSHLPRARAWLAAIALLPLSIASAQTAPPAPTAPKSDKLMTFPELKACMIAKRSNEASAAALKKTQESVLSDLADLRKEQVAIEAANVSFNQEALKLAGEHSATQALLNSSALLEQSAKTDEEKAAAAAARGEANARSEKFRTTMADLSGRQRTHNDRVGAFNARAALVNAAQKTADEKVAPIQKADADWRATCGNRRYREEDEKEILQELK